MAKSSTKKPRDASLCAAPEPSRQELLLRLLAREAEAAANEIANTGAAEFWAQGPVALRRKLDAGLKYIDETLDELEFQADRLNKTISAVMLYRRDFTTELPPVWDDDFDKNDPNWVDVRTAAARFGFDQTTVRKHIKRYGIGERYRGRCFVSLKRARVLYSSVRFRRRYS